MSTSTAAIESKREFTLSTLCPTGVDQPCVPLSGRCARVLGGRHQPDRRGCAWVQSGSNDVSTEASFHFTCSVSIYAVRLLIRCWTTGLPFGLTDRRIGPHTGMSFDP